MSAELQSPSIVVVCSEQGVIQQITRDTLGLAGLDVIGKSFIELFDRGSAYKAVEFFKFLIRHGAAFDWELNLQVNGRITAWHFVGSVAETRCVVTGAPSSFDAAAQHSAAVAVHGQDAAAIERTCKELALWGRQVDAEGFSNRYDEFSRLNNDLVNMQRELAKKNAELDRINQEKNRLLGIVAHDLRNPLNVILGYHGLLRDELADVLAQEQREIFSVVRSSIEYMRQLIDELLDFAQFELGALQLHLEAVDVVELVRNTVALNRGLANRKQIELAFASEMNVPAVMLDRLKMEQVLNNIIGNAIKFSHPHTRIDVRIYTDEKRLIIRVQDRGQGIPAAELERLFKPFQKTSVKPTAGESSVGLGLAIVREIVNGHGGSIQLESTVGKGTECRITLPVANDRSDSLRAP
jgi:signal transduction histidine kinase